MKLKILEDFQICISVPLSKRSIESFDWSKLFLSKNAHEQVGLFNKTLLNIFHDFIPNKIILCDDRDPPWMNDEIKKND